MNEQDHEKMAQLVTERDELLANHKDSIGTQARIWQHFIEQSHTLLFGKRPAMANNHEQTNRSSSQDI